MVLRLRQVALVARDLTAAEDDIQRMLGTQVCFRDPGVGEFGLHNALFALGDQFLEVVSPTTGGTTAGRLLHRRGDGGYMAIFQVDDLDHVEDRMRRLGIRVVFDARGDGVRGLHLHPADVGGAIVSIDACDDPAAWPWAGSSWGAQPTALVTGIAGIRVAVEDPDATCERWAAALDVEPDAGGRSLSTEDAIVRFESVDDGRFGITGVQIGVAPGSTLDLPAPMVGIELSS